MTEHETEVFFTDISELLDIFNQYSPVQTNGTFVTESVKPCILEMVSYIVKDKTEAAAL